MLLVLNRWLKMPKDTLNLRVPDATFEQVAALKQGGYQTNNTSIAVQAVAEAYARMMGHRDAPVVLLSDESGIHNLPICKECESAITDMLRTAQQEETET